MELKNGYKLIYEAAKREDNVLKVYATKATFVTAEDKKVNFGEDVDVTTFKLIYEKDNKLFGSLSNTPTADDVEITLTIDGEEVLGSSLTGNALPDKTVIVAGETYPEKGATFANAANFSITFKNDTYIASGDAAIMSEDSPEAKYWECKRGHYCVFKINGGKNVFYKVARLKTATEAFPTVQNNDIRKGYREQRGAETLVCITGLGNLEGSIDYTGYNFFRLQVVENESQKVVREYLFDLTQVKLLPYDTTVLPDETVKLEVLSNGDGSKFENAANFKLEYTNGTYIASGDAAVIEEGSKEATYWGCTSGHYCYFKINGGAGTFYRSARLKTADADFPGNSSADPIDGYKEFHEGENFDCLVGIGNMVGNVDFTGYNFLKVQVLADGTNELKREYLFDLSQVKY